MKNISKVSKFLMVFGTLLVSACGTTGSNSSSYTYEEELNPVTINSLKEGLMHMNKETNFTLDVYANRSLYYSIYYTDKYIGADSDGAKYMKLFINDGNGIFMLSSTNNEVVSGEYELDEDGKKYTDLYNGDLYPVMKDIATSYVEDFDSSVNEINISSKAWKISFIQAIGFTTTSYVSLDYVNAKYLPDTHGISFDCSFNNGSYRYNVIANNFGSTTNGHYRSFMKSGGKVFTPSAELKKFRELLKLDNFVRMTYDLDAQGYISMENFHEHYFYTQYYGSNTYTGYMSMNHKKTSEEDADLKGCYFFNVDDKGSPHFQTMAFSDNPNIPEFFHYPKFLNLLTKLQYMKHANHPDVTYQRGTTRYVVTDIDLVKDFAKNFSLNQTWSFDEVPPYALAIELNFDSADIAQNTIIFHYLMRYNGQNYDYIIPICDFGKVDNPLLNRIYEAYND